MQGHDGEKLFLFADTTHAILTAEDVTFTPFVSNDRVGYQITHPDGCKEFISLVPSSATDEGPDTSNVFIYQSDSVIDTLGEAQSHITFSSHERPRPTDL